MKKLYNRLTASKIKGGGNFKEIFYPVLFGG